MSLEIHEAFQLTTQIQLTITSMTNLTHQTRMSSFVKITVNS